MARTASQRSEDCDVLVVGAGMVGSTLAVALAGAGLSVVLIDGQDPEMALQETFDGRSSAIARGSQQALASLGLWQAMAEGAEAILDIRVSDGRIGAGTSALFLHYDHREVDDAPLGYIVENRVTQRVLRARLGELPNLRLRAPRRVEDLERSGTHVAARLDDGTALRARLIVGAEGRRSPTREAAGIRTTSWSYSQVGLVATVAHELPHNGVAHENFLPAGPFAMLPMTDGADGTHRSSIVWTERPELAATLLARPVGGRWSYPLSMIHAKRTIDRRLALVGDAAHVIHPISGQGLNLGLKDVAALAESVVDAWRLGLDPGDELVLERYQRWRRLDNLVLVAVTDGLNRLFSNNLAPVRLARDLGLAAVNQAPPLKRLFMGHAMGLMGDLPRLIRGEAL
jgi:2-octaprenyl-6-methoxyphenol hydroxylase